MGDKRQTGLKNLVFNKYCSSDMPLRHTDGHVSLCLLYLHDLHQFVIETSAVVPLGIEILPVSCHWFHSSCKFHGKLTHSLFKISRGYFSLHNANVDENF